MPCCNECGRQVPQGQVLCKQCEQAQEQASPRSRAVSKRGCRKAVVVCLLLALAVSAVACGLGQSGRRPTATPSLVTHPPMERPTVAARRVSFRTVDLDDVSTALAVRFRVSVVTHFPVSTADVSYICEATVQDLKQRKPLNAVVVFMYDSRSLLSGGYSIARCTYAPNGDWARASETRAGDYSTHRIVYAYQGKVRAPEDAMKHRPTQDEYELAKEWEELYEELDSPTADPQAVEQAAIARIAKKHGLSAEAVDDTVLKVVLWTMR